MRKNNGSHVVSWTKSNLFVTQIHRFIRNESHAGQIQKLQPEHGALRYVVGVEGSWHQCWWLMFW